MRVFECPEVNVTRDTHDKSKFSWVCYSKKGHCLGLETNGTGSGMLSTTDSSFTLTTASGKKYK